MDGSTKKRGNIIFSSFMTDKTPTKKVAYLALFSAFAAISNLFELPLADNQISLTIFASAIIGVISGGVSGFLVCFIGDLIGFFLTKAGLAYSPFVGISTGLLAFFAGLFSLRKSNNMFIVFLKIFAYCIITFVCCTLFINTLYFYFAFSTKSVGFFEYAIGRLFVKFQILNSLVNYALIILVYPLLKKLKPFEELFIS